MGAGILGSTDTIAIETSYDTVRDLMVSDAADESDDGIVGFLPTSAQFTASLGVTGNLAFAKANGKALGITGLDAQFGIPDAFITFNTNFNFDYDNRDGVGSGLFDFETVAAHEIGHALGFFSAVNSADAGETSLTPNTLDLFRFADNVEGKDPSTPGEFTTMAREFRAGAIAITDEISREYQMSTGQMMGDGQQAGHWKDSLQIGIMDPTLAPQEVVLVGSNDFRALDLIGYEVSPLPEPATWAAAIGLLGLAAYRECRKFTAQRKHVS